MISDEAAKEMMRNLSLTGAVTEGKGIKPIINGNLQAVLNLSSGSPRLQTNVVKRFSLILSQPTALSALSSFEIRCAFCKRVIRYPCWYYSIRYAVSVFHYFVCFDSSSPNSVNCKCYKRG